MDLTHKAQRSLQPCYSLSLSAVCPEIVMEPRFLLSSERLEKPGIEPTTPGSGGKQLNHYARKASDVILVIFKSTVFSVKFQKSTF